MECRLLQEDALKIVVLICSVPTLNMLLFAGNGDISSATTTSEIIQSMFGSVVNFSMNWMYWIFICLGYFLLLHTVWKSQVHMFEVYQIIRYRNIGLFWKIKFLTGFLMTACYVFSCLIVTFAVSLLWHAQAMWDIQWIVVFVSLTLNLYIHALTWLVIRLFSTVEMAIIVVGLLFYAGVRIVEPYIPLYYAMADHISPYWLPTFAIELLIIVMLMTLIIWKAKKSDF